MMRRLTKEELYRFDGTPLFPERRAYTASYGSRRRADLYQAVTGYVREEMNRADRSADGKRRNNVGFALQILHAVWPPHLRRSIARLSGAASGWRSASVRRGCSATRARPAGARAHCAEPTIPTIDEALAQSGGGEERSSTGHRRPTLAELKAEIAPQEISKSARCA